MELDVAVGIEGGLVAVFEGRNAGDVSPSGLVELGDVASPQFVHFFAVTEFDKCFTHATFPK